MRKGECSPRSTVVLTTHERFGYFSSVLGDDVDARFNPHREPALEDLLHNISVSGGKLVVIDEAFFFSANDMVAGIERYVDSVASPKCLEFIVVCSQRAPGDGLLAHLVTYCQIYDIIFGKNGAELCEALCTMLDHPQTRSSVVELIACERWGERIARSDDMKLGEHEWNPAVAPAQIASSNGVLDHRISVDANTIRELSIKVEIQTQMINRDYSSW